MKKLLYILIFVLFINIGLSLQDSCNVNKNCEIKIPCSNYGGSCSPTTQCNISIIYPNTTTFISKQNMTKIQDYFNYTFTNTSNPGKYSAYIICCDETIEDINLKCDNNIIEFNVYGGITYFNCPNTIPESILFISIIFILIVLFSFAYYVKNGYLGIMSTVGLLFMSFVYAGCNMFIGAFFVVITVLLLIWWVFQEMY